MTTTTQRTLIIAASVLALVALVVFFITLTSSESTPAHPKAVGPRVHPTRKHVVKPKHKQGPPKPPAVNAHDVHELKKLVSGWKNWHHHKAGAIFPKTQKFEWHKQGKNPADEDVLKLPKDKYKWRPAKPDENVYKELYPKITTKWGHFQYHKPVSPEKQRIKALAKQFTRVMGERKAYNAAKRLAKAGPEPRGPH